VTLPSGFPRRTLKGSRQIYRIHRTENSPWWFSSDGSGRFDPLGTDLGACYLAERPLGAWIEVFRRRMLLAEAEVRERALFAVTLGRDLQLADLTSRRALQFGATASVGADERYAASQEFAAEAALAGFHGLRYLVRHDPAQQLYGIALFSEQPAGIDDPAWPSEHDTAIPEELVTEASRRFGYKVLPTP
jgi:hypothetical protein